MLAHDHFLKQSSTTDSFNLITTDQPNRSKQHNLKAHPLQMHFIGTSNVPTAPQTTSKQHQVLESVWACLSWSNHPGTLHQPQHSHQKVKGWLIVIFSAISKVSHISTVTSPIIKMKFYLNLIFIQIKILLLVTRMDGLYHDVMVLSWK